MISVKKRAVLLWVGVATTLVVIGGAAWWWTHRSDSSVDKASDTASTSAERQAAWSSREQKIREFEAKNDTEGALKYYGQLVQQAPNSDEKRSLLFEQSNLALRVKQYETALRLMDEAEAIKSGVDVVTQRALIYQAMGDKAKAATQYRQAIEMTKDTNGGQGDRYAPIWRAKVEELER